jgi:hypothetical protein
MSSALVWIGVALTLALLGTLAAVLYRYVPFDAPSYAAWAGIGIAMVSLLWVVKPPGFLGIRGRKGPLLGAMAGVGMALVAVFLPAPVVRADGPHKRLDDFLPDYQFREYHELVVQAPPERVAAAAREVSFGDMPAAVWLMRLRRLAGGRPGAGHVDRRPILEIMARPGSGFLPLDVSNPREIVYGMVGRPWTNERPPRVSTAEGFQAFHTPGHIRVAFDIHIVDLGEGRVRVSTETRTLGNDDASRRVFARYWRLIYPGSAIIRGVWLEAIASKARG